MMPSFYFDSLPVEWISLSLLHFLWQACVVGSIAALGFACLRRSPNGRYLWGVACFMCLAVCPVATFCWLQPSSHDVARLRQLEAIDAIPAGTFLIPEAIHDADGAVETAFAEPIDRWQVGHLLIVAIWLFGQLFVGGRLVISGYFVYRLKQAAEPVDKELRKLAHQLANKMGVVCPLIATTDRITSAIAAGFFRQIVVIPTAWLTEMTPDMLEAVISHELAHLRRHDLWINLFQRIVESVLFFHPIVWWLSNRIRHEREVCCDLLAIGATKQRKHYAETLEHVARLGACRSTLLVTQIGDDKMSLLSRVRFVLGQQQPASSLGWWPAGVLAIVIPCGLFWLSHTPLSFAQQQAETALMPTPAQAINPDIAPTAYDAVAVPPPTFNLPIKQKNPEKKVVQVAKAPAAIAKTDARLAKEWKLGEYMIEPPDVIRISIDRDVHPKAATRAQGELRDAVCGEHLVAADGTVNFGKYGRVSITGMSTEKAAAAICEQLTHHTQKPPKVSLELAVMNSKFFYVIILGSGLLGDQVVRIPVTGNETVLDAISLIGGIAQASDKHLFVKRPDHKGQSEHVLQVDWDAITRGSDTASNHQLLPGDRLFVSTTPADAAPEPEVIGATLPSPYYEFDDVTIRPKIAEFHGNQNRGHVVQRRNPGHYDGQGLTLNPDFAPTAYDIAISETANGGVEAALANFDSSLHGLAQSKDAKQVPANPGPQAEHPRQGFPHRIPLMGPMTTEGKAKVIEPPSNIEIFRFIQIGMPDSALARPESQKGVEIERKLIADYVDPPKFYPLIGPAQLHHAHYKYVLPLGKGEPHVLYIDHQHLHVSEEMKEPEPDATVPALKSGSEMITECYYVADLVLPIKKPRFTESGEQERVKDADPDFDSLIQLVSSTIAPDSWEEVGGAGTIQPFEANLSLVVSQTATVHKELRALLAQLKGLQEIKVMLRATNLRLTESLTKKLGLHGKLLAVLTAEERQQVLEAARRDARARTFADSKATLFNGQLMTMTLDNGQSIQMQGVVGANRKSVRFVAGLQEPSGKAVTQSAQLTNKQSLLVRMKDDSREDGTSVFRLITAELAEPNEEN